MIGRNAALTSILVAGLAPAAMAEGDVEYGEYLAAECTTCHLTGAEDAAGGVPLITGWDPEVFVIVLQDYADGFREHGPMQMIASRLEEEEMAALAAYFAIAE